MEVIVKNVNEKPELREMDEDETLEFLREVVGGHIEAVHLVNGIILILNEEGKLIGLEENFNLGGDPIVGNVAFISSKGTEFAGLDEEQKEFIFDAFS